MSRNLFRIGDTMVNLQFVTKIEHWRSKSVPLYWNHVVGAEDEYGGDGLAIHMFPNTVESYSPAFIKQAGWDTPEALAEAISNALDAVNG